MKYILFILIATVFFSCERSVDIDMPQHTPKLVLNAQLAQNRLFSVQVSKSIPITETIPINYQSTYYILNNAIVVVKENNKIVDTLKFNSTNSRYTSTTKRTRQDSSYTIEVSAPGFTSVSAESKMPAFIRPSKIAIKKDVRIIDGQPQSEVAITFTDLTGADYYLFRFRNTYGGFNCVYTNDNAVEKMGYSDPFSNNQCYDSDRLPVSDATFNGKEKTIVFYVYSYLLQPQYDPGTGKTIRPWLEMQHITKDFFQYILSKGLYDNVDENPLAEPVNVVRNVKNGYGFFTVYSVSVDTLRY